jgi:hypothetical protein
VVKKVSLKLWDKKGTSRVDLVAPGCFFYLQAAPKGTSAALRESFVIAAYEKVRLIPHDITHLAPVPF